MVSVRSFLCLALLLGVDACKRTNKCLDADARAALRADLEAFAFTHAKGSGASPIFYGSAVYGGRADVIGLPTGNVRAPFAWVVANLEACNGEVMTATTDGMVNARVYMPCSYLDELQTATKMTQPVRDYLVQRCQ